MSHPRRSIGTMNESIPPMTTSELAAHLGVSPRTVKRRVVSGELSTIGKLPGKTGAWLFDRAVIDSMGEAA